MSTLEALTALLKPNPVFAIVRECSRDRKYPVYVAGSTISYTVWESVYGVAKPPEDLDIVYFDEGGEFCDEELESRIRDCTGLEVHAYNQAMIHKMPKFSYRPARTSMVDAVENYCDTPACVVARVLDDGVFDVIAPYGVTDLFNGVVRVTKPEFKLEVVNRAKKKQWQSTWPQIRVVDEHGINLPIVRLVDGRIVDTNK